MVKYPSLKIKRPLAQCFKILIFFVGKMAFQGDSIICAINYGKSENGKVPVVFTLNGEMIYEASMTYEKGKQELYPFIGMGHEGIRVLAKVRDLFEYVVPSKGLHCWLF